MDQETEEIRTEIVDEQESTPKKKGKRMWLYIGLGAVLVVIISVALMMAFRKPQRQALNPTAEELEQQKYDSEQAEARETEGRPDPRPVVSGPRWG